MLTPDYQTPARMALKQAAIPLPELGGKSVLDVGCDMGAWCRLALDRGAKRVVGLDRNRKVRGSRRDLIEENRAALPGAEFFKIDLGKQWYEFGRFAFDAVFVFSMYHHWFENCGDHRPIWYWLRQHCAPGGAVLWEGPVDTTDPVVRVNVSPSNQAHYSLIEILAAASQWFTAEEIGPALHEPSRRVWRFEPHAATDEPPRLEGVVQSGAGGASKAFEFADGRRIAEIESILGLRPWAGSLNVLLAEPFNWSIGYFRAPLLDVMHRAAGLGSAWSPRWARFYPLEIEGLEAVPLWAIRFEGENYPENFMELIAPVRLRDVVAETVTLVPSR